MNNDQPIADGPEHDDISSLMPWYVNGTVGEVDRQRVDSHLANCATCRYELLQERHLHQQMKAEVGIEYMPGPSLKRLQAKLDALDTGTPQRNAPPTQPRPGRLLPWLGLLAASAAVMAVALNVSLGDRWMQFHTSGAPSVYRTVTTAQPRPPGEIIRAVFAPTMTVAELQSILVESQLRIISGPTEAGVYSLAATSGRPVDASMEALRRHASVRFAESTQPVPDPGTPR